MIYLNMVYLYAAKFRDRRIYYIFFAFFSFTLATTASAGGISIGGTRLIYSADDKQSSISIRNVDASTTFLTQSWVEDSQGTNTSDFVVTPPIYVSAPGNENILRIVATRNDFVKDKETLYFFNVKAVPSVGKEERGNGSITIATVTRIKLFVRPEGLPLPREKAAGLLKFSRRGNRLQISNPTPYYMTLVNIKVSGHVLDNVMVPPQGAESVSLPVSAGKTLTFGSINDYGGTDIVQARVG
ncbi:fimbria/pilus periplasmic chaperone [Serratia marcescens]|uniref:fimbria/pilus periplasmic chaperone n=1 Tax=Serratia marcescens TaxID=615 RepID=UPI003983CFEE